MPGPPDSGSTAEILARLEASGNKLCETNRRLRALIEELVEREEFRELARKVWALIQEETAKWPERKRRSADPPPTR